MDGAVDPAAVGACLERFSETLDKKSSVRIDNAPLHRSQAFIRPIPPWVNSGLIITYFPTYAPELHLSEILWRFIQYYW